MPGEERVQAGWTTHSPAQELAANGFVHPKFHPPFSWALLEVLSLLHRDRGRTHPAWLDEVEPTFAELSHFSPPWFSYRCFVPDLCIPGMPGIP